MRSVIFVCTANICRSPMAERLLKKLVEPDLQNWRIESAGTWASGGQPASTRAAQILEKRGVSLQDHRSKSVDQELLESFNLILVMEKGHKEALGVEFPDLAGRIYLLSEMAGKEQEIRDPMGGNTPDFEAAADEIETLLQAGLSRIRELASG